MTEQLLVTKTETVQNDNDEPEIHLFGRTVDKDRKHLIIKGLEPYFYVPTPGVQGEETGFVGTNGIISIDHDVDFQPFDMGDVPESVSKVTLGSDRDRSDAKRLFDRTWEGDVKLRNRFRIDTETKAWIEVAEGRDTFSPDEITPIESPVDTDPEPRIVTLDIEVDDRGGFPEPGEKRVTSIVAHDNYEGAFIGFMDGDGRDISQMFPDGKPEEVDTLHIEPDERRMLIEFACWFSERDPDMLTAWNVDFDAEYLIARMENVGANPDRLSPLNDAEINFRDNAKIRGVSVYDLLQMYKKNMWGELRSYSLDYVAGEELDAQKIIHDRGFFEMFEEDPPQLINYNAKDTRLAVGINEAAGVIEFRDNLRKQVGVDFEDTVNNYQFVEMMCRRKLHERGEVGPTADPEDSEDYEGGYVVDAYTGVAQNVMGIDVESLYPWTMYMLNASPDTKISEKEAKANDIPYSKAPNGVCFRLDKDGLFRELVDDALALKEGFRTLRDNAEPGSVEEAVYAVKYQVSKTLTNSIYGVIGWEQFFLYDRDTAEAVTLAGQEVLKASADYVDDHTDAKVIYGDTDSNYISFPTEWDQQMCVDTALDICERLESEVYPPLSESMNVPAEDCEWRIDPEMFAPRFFQYGRKKKYAYRATWKEGMAPGDTMDEPEVAIKGSASKRSDASRLTRDTDKACIKAILDGRSDDCNQIIYEAATSLDPANPDWNRIGIPGGIGKEFAEYESKTAHVEAAENANALLETDFGKGSKPMRVYLRPTYIDELGEKVDRIAYESAEDLRPMEDRLEIDAGRMTDTLLVNPLGTTLDAVGVDVEAAVEGQHQTGLGAF